MFIFCRRTQSLKLQVGETVKFGPSFTEENWERVNIYPDTHVSV